MIKKFICLLIMYVFFCTNVYSNDNITLKSNAPKVYVVQKGDSLWSIAKLYLDKPWQWPLLWGFNKEQIKNPHFIYPNQVLYLSYNNNSKPNLSLKNNINNNSTNVKLSPHTYETTKEYNIPSIPLNLIQNFIEYPKIIPQSEVIKSPKIINSPNHKQLLSSGDIAYAINIKEPGNYLVYRIIKPITSPGNYKKIIGNEVEIIGEVATIEPSSKNLTEKSKRFTQKGIFKVPTIVATPMIILKSRAEIKSTDKLYKLSNNNNYERFNFMPHAPSKQIKAFILYAFKEFSNLEYSKFNNIVINRGENDGIDKGTILSLYKNYPLTTTITENTLKNPINNTNQSIKYIAFPTNEVGKAMVYYTEKNISYAIIIESSATVEIGDIASNPGMNLQDLDNNN